MPVPTPKTPPNQPKRRRLRIGEREIRSMAELMAKRLNEAEAARILGIEPRSWYKWRQRMRNEGRFTALLENLTGVRLAAHLQNIELAAVGAGPHKRADWRASSFVLAATAPDRFTTTGGAPQAPTAPTPALPATINFWLGAAYAHANAAPAPAQVVDVAEVLALPEPGTAEPPPPAPPGRSYWEGASAATEPPPPTPKRRAPPMLPEK